MTVEVLVKKFPRGNAQSYVVELPEGGGFIKVCDGVHVRLTDQEPADSDVGKFRKEICKNARKALGLK